MSRLVDHAGRSAAVLLTAGWLAACSGGTPPILGCEAGDGIEPDCRFQNPEDLVASPAGAFILVSQFGDMEGHRPGSLVALDPASGDIRPLYPEPRNEAPTPGWGHPDCGPPDTGRFAPHGIDLKRLDSGTDALYVVNHGGRESVEMFEVREDDDALELVWRGCVVAPDDGYFNDVLVLANGDFRVSQMFPRGANVLWTALRMQLTGYAPGHALHWSPARGFEYIPGTDAKFANGLAQSPDERFLYVNSYFGNEVIKVDTQTGTRIGSVAVPSPDNLSWSPTGELLAAGHLASITETLGCQDLATGSCGFRFQIVAIDTEALTGRVVLDHAGPPMGAATVALPFGEHVYLGTFAGDRIARVPAAVLDLP
ncbi:MAG: hypothetical protein KF911_09085 [Pseudomonadales bacterium]|nr:hypothetical protein [Pseudomonadales bacterium]